MNVHILVRCGHVGGEVNTVETFSSRQNMTTRHKEYKSSEKVYMFPPVPVERSVDGILSLASLINDIHVLGPVQVLERLENDQC